MERWSWVTQADRAAGTIALAAFALLAACGGSDNAPVAGEVGRELPQALANVVLDAENPAVVRSGRFEPATGYLARSARVWRSTDPAASFTYKIRAPHAGYYELFAWWPQALRDAGPVRFEIAHAQGRSTVEADQRNSGGEWVSLGFFPLAGNLGASVTLRAAGGALYGDALRFQFAGSVQPPLQWRQQNLPVGLKDTEYAGQVSAVGGISPYRYRVETGDLPPGLRLDESSGHVAGRAAKGGNYPVVVSARGADGASILLELSITIDDSAAADTPAPPRPAAREQRADAGTPDLSQLLNIVAALPEGGWQKVNLNSFNSVWAPADLRPLLGRSNPPPSRIIMSWSSFAWDSHRARLVLYGGGHANYRGNDVYLWDAATRLWQRASLPSAMLQDTLGNWNAIDGVDKAPASAHTYDNTMFFPLIDRVVVLGGAADANGGHYLTQATASTSRKTGPYLFDPARADGDKVGGSTGSHVQRVAPYPDIVGGNMWSNRESWLLAGAGSTPPSENFINGCGAVAPENGKDVAYVRTAHRLYRYTIHDLSNPAADSWQLVGRYYNTGSGAQATCGYDPTRKVFVVAGGPKPESEFIYWNLNTPSSGNREVAFTPVDPTGEFATLLASNAIRPRNCGMKFDPRRGDYKLWCGDGRVWSLKQPEPLGAAGWSITKEPVPTTPVPSETLGTGILGKWKYIPNLDVFMGLADPVLGNIWVYKPRGWVNPSGGNLPPQVGLTQPQSGAAYLAGDAIGLSAVANDSDGQVIKVEYYANNVKIGESTGAPHGAVWSGAGVGSWTLSAVATDDDGAQTTSSPVTITVQAPQTNQPPSITLDQPLDGASFPFGNAISLQATAGDGDGQIVRVEFYSGPTKIGETTQAPYALSWANAPVGTHSLTALAIDDDGASAASAPRTIQVLGGGSSGTVTLQRGTSPVTAVSDTYLSSYHKALNFGAVTYLQDRDASYSPLLRFAVFQSEGGPVPNGAEVTSALLSIYKFSSYNMVYGLHRLLQDWQEGAATWNQRAPGLAWAVAGANGPGTDYAATADVTAAADFSAGWLHFDVTAALTGMSLATPTANYGWRLRGVSGYTSGLKKMYSSEFTADPSLRPKLEITFSSQ